MLNETDSKALILDYSLNVALLDGQTGSCLIKDHGRKKDYVLPPNSTWTQSTTTFDDFFRSLNSLQPILTLGMQNGTEFSSANTSQPIPEAARRNLSRLGLTNQDLEMFSSALNGSLGWMYRGRGSFNVRNGLRWFVMMNLAFNTWFENPQAQEVLRSLEPLDLGAIFGANTCVEALINLFSQLANRTDIAGVITGKNREPENFLRLAEYAIGVSNDGVDGLLTVMTEVVLVLLGNGSFPGVLEAYLLYRPDPSVNLGTLRGLAEQVEGVIQEQDRRYNNTVRNNIGWLDEDVANCLNNNCVLNGVNLTDVAAFLTANSWPEAAGALGRIIGRLLGSPDDFFEFSNAALSNVRPSNLPQIIAGFHKDIPQVIATLIKNAAPSQLISNFIRFVSDLPQAVFRFIGATVGNLNFPRTIAEFSARLTSLWSNVQRALKSVVANATPGKFFSDMIELAVSVSRSILQMLPGPLLNLYNYTTNFLFGGSDPKYIVDDLVWTFRNVSGDLILSLPEPLRGLVNATSTVLTTVLCGSDPAQIIADVSGTIKNWTSGLASFSPIPLGDLGNVTALWSTASNLPFVGPFLSVVAGPKSQQIRADLGDTVQSLVRRFFDSPVGRVLRDLLLTVVSVVTQLVDGLVGLVTGGSSSPTVGRASNLKPEEERKKKQHDRHHA
ncbi:hypothetical protein NQ318_009877 [Aromia moschata]|uniref:Uncharacterized protein n=1 Tax=Aromia moschata TaxID=1265417 RepID=A0AAV8Y3F3_9CUCU|nr:hypothetical protein NQ318_009877 [Aromia moschata]